MVRTSVPRFETPMEFLDRGINSRIPTIAKIYSVRPLNSSSDFGQNK